MRNDRTTLPWLVALLVTLGAAPVTLASGPPDAPYRQGEILVRFKSGVPRSRMGAIHAKHGATVKRDHPKLRFETVTIPGGTSVEELIRAYRGEPDVAVAEPNYLVHALSLPNDPSFGLQWALDNTGQTTGTPDADVDAPEAWAVTRGESSIVVAVLDTGVGISHPDLAARISVNPREIPDNELDEDGNGYVDDVNGWDFVGHMNWPDDFNGHGTHVASIIAAGQDDGIGISGIAPAVRVMPVQVLDRLGTGDDATIADGIVYAADNGARIANMSFGGTGDNTMLHDALRYAHGKGVTLVAAAGNQYGGPLLFPAAYDDVVLAVAATDDFDRRADFSSAGPSVDVAAPGKAIYAAWRYSSQFAPEASRFVYTTASGTSMASPLVAGIAALILSQDPSLGPARVMDQLRYTAEDVNAADHPGRDDWIGFGRVNAHRALTMSARPALAVAWQSIDDAAGNANGRADPGEAVDLAVTLSNAWADAASVTATLASADPCVSVTGGSASFGPVAAGATASSASRFALRIATGCPGGKRISLALDVRANGISTVLSVPLTIGAPPILFVSDGGGPAVLPYTDALDAIGLPYDVWVVPFDADGPPAAELAPYAVVVWNAAQVAKPAGSVTFISNSLSSADVVALSSYLDGGGRLLLASSTLGQGAGMANGLSEFIATRLHAATTLGSYGRWVAGAAAERFAGIRLRHPGRGPTYVDPDAASSSLFVDDDGASSYPGRSVGLRYPATGPAPYRVVYLGFDLPDLDSPDGRRFILQRSIETLLDQPLSVKAILPPVCKTGGYGALDVDGSGDEKVTLDATASYDPEGGALSFAWKESGKTLARSATTAARFTVGTHYLLLTCTAPEGAARSVAVVAQIDPALAANAGPSVPAKPSGPTIAQPGIPTAFTTVATDPEGEPIRYDFQWRGRSQWEVTDTFLTQLHPSGVPVTLAHLFPAPGGYTLRTQAFDRTGDRYSSEYSYSKPLHVTVSDPGAPVISNVRATDVTASTAVVRWTTSVPASSMVVFTNDRESMYWNDVEDPALTEDHAITVPNLLANRTAFLEVRSTDAAGATAVDWASGAHHRVVTLPATGLLHVADVTVAVEPGPKTYATATVTIVDQAGRPLPGATLWGSWNGAATAAASGVTDASGRLTIRSDQLHGAVPRDATMYAFTVTDVVLAGWTYERTANDASGDWVTVN